MDDYLTDIEQPASLPAGVPPAAPDQDGAGDAKFVLQQRHYDMALAEQAVYRARGRHMSVEEILKRNGFRIEDKKKAGISNQRRDLNAQNLRIYIPSSVQAAMGICLLELKDGLLRVATGDRFEENELERIILALKRGNCFVEHVEIEPWDKAELARLMREQTEIAGERLVRLFATLSKDPDNATMIEQSVHDILAEALQMRTSDIHLTLQEDDARCWIRYRVDGDLVYKHLIPNRIMAPIVTRIKTDAKMDAADRQHPQDGRLAFEWQGRMIDVRVASMPVAPSGEKITMRLLDRDNLRSFDELFAHAAVVAGRLRRTVHGHVKDGGLIVVSGPTGSGKSTTLYGIIQEIDRTAKAVYSVEAPVEYDMPLVDQTSVTEHSDNDIAGMIRALMRHDPDIIIVGEMRDSETVEAALRATESGHLVITTVHAVNALHVIDRIDGFLSSAYRTSGLYILGHALIGSLSQRLVKTVCPACHKQQSAMAIYQDAHKCSDLGFTQDDMLAVADRNGCDLCNHTGFLGRALALEALFPPDDQSGKRAMTEMILSNVTNSIVDIPGTFYLPREQSVKDLIKRRVVDAHMGAALLVEELATKAGRR